MTNHKSRTWISLGGKGPPRITPPPTGTWGYIHPGYLLGCRATVHHTCAVHTDRISKWFRTAPQAYEWYKQQLAHFDTCP